jgi:hypothetical protein
MGDSDSFCFSDGEYIGGTTSTHLQTMNFKTLVAPVAALTLLVGGVVSTQEAKAGYNCRTNAFGNQECSGTMNGQRMNTTTRSNVFGGYETTGTVGGQRFSQTCRSSAFGGYDCD